MPHTIEDAKTSRSSCRTCKDKIEKGMPAETGKTTQQDG